jgi:hypothetical protein
VLLPRLHLGEEHGGVKDKHAQLSCVCGVCVVCVVCGACVDVPRP